MAKGRGAVAIAAIFFALLNSSGAVGASSCKLIRLAEWPVHPEDGELRVEGTLNGQKIGILLDTGAWQSLLPRSAVERLGLTRLQSPGYRAFGVGGETHVEMAHIAEFKIGEATRKNWRVLVVGEHDMGPEIDFILGQDFFSQADVEFDLAHGFVRLYRSKDCDGVSLAYWAEGKASTVELDEIDPQLLLKVQINGQPVRVKLDSGAGGSVLNRAKAARLGVTAATPGVVELGKLYGMGEKSVVGWLGNFESFVIGDEKVSNPRIRFADISMQATGIGSRLASDLVTGHEMLLGLDFLRAHRVLIAHGQRKLYFTYVGGRVFGPTPGSDEASDPTAQQSSQKTAAEKQ